MQQMVIWILVFRVLILIMLFLLSLVIPSFAYGRSVEDLVGVFSLEKTIKLGSSSECFSSKSVSDPLSPPQSPITSALADDQPPSLAGFSFEPARVMASSPQPINFAAHVIDDQGVWAAAAYFSSPTRDQVVEVIFNAKDLLSGTKKDGFYAAKTLLPTENEIGDWMLENLTLVDQEGNRRILLSSDLQRLGLPTVIIVI
jgi:hypothetical protein